jgi:shikimate dehydrogenase
MPDHDYYAVFGHPINHSQSPRIHRLFAEQTGQTRVLYEARDVRPEQFETCVQEFIAHGGKGLNCTLPLKELAFRIAAENSRRAIRCKAVNTLAVREDGSLFGDNTDGIGLVRDLRDNLKLALEGLDILLVGAGGASRGILGPILECNPGSVYVANRTAAKARDLADDFDQFNRLCAGGLDELDGRRFDLILNATAASLQDQSPDLPDNVLKPGGVCYDLAYGSRPTAFLRWGRLHNASISVDGIGMLVEQAAEAFRIWRGVLPDTRPVIEILKQERAG